VLWLGVCLLVGSAGIWAGQDKSANDGVYSETQAIRGETLFERNCTNCHDTARFKGDFIGNWADQPLAAVYDVMKTTMPEDNPGSLRPQQYADILTFILKLNGFPAGETELAGTDAAMKAVRLEKPTPR